MSLVKMWCVVLLIGLQTVTGISLSDAEQHRLPRLFHADDYARCLAQPGGLYCMGSFRLTPATSPHHMYDVMKEYSSGKHSYDRTLLHRGYCVTSRCADAAFNGTSLADHALRFESCVQKWARSHKLTTRLETLHYCRGPDHRQLELREAQQEDSNHQLWLTIVYTVGVMNLVGTVYDVMLGDDVKKNKLLMSWSCRNNWHRLVADFDSDERLTTLNPIQGIRVILLMIVIVAHAGQIHFMLYTYNPSYVEWISGHPAMMIVTNGAALVQVFVMFSSFLLSYNMLIYSKNHRLTFALLPKAILVRIARIAPTALLVILFAATWWPLLQDSAVWQLVVTEESNVCKRKLWSHMLFINNYVESNRQCLIQTWFLAVDMQLYLLAAMLTLGMAQFKVKTQPALSKLFVVVCLFNGVLAYIYEWKPLMYISSPESLRTMFKDVPSFAGVYTSAWGSLPASIVGLYVAHKHYNEETEAKKIEHSYLFRFLYTWSIPLVFAWMLAGNLVAGSDSRLLGALCVGVERPGFTLFAAVVLYGFCKRIEHPLRTVCGWHGFRVLARMSLSALMVHWCIDMLVAAARPMLFSTSLFNIFVDGIATWVFTYILAIPLTIMLEMPVYRTTLALFQR